MPPSILIVDDESGLRRMLRQALSGVGYVVSEASDGEEALKTCAEDAALHLVLTDIRMPRMDGCQLATRLATLRPELPVLLMTGYTLPSECEQSGRPLIRKPFRLDALAKAVSELLPSPPAP